MAAQNQNPFDEIIDQIRKAAEEGAERGVKRALSTAAATEDKPAPESAWMRSGDLAKKYNLPKTFFEEKGREGLIERSRPGRYVLFNVRDVERFLKSRSSGGANGDH